MGVAKDCKELGIKRVAQLIFQYICIDTDYWMGFYIALGLFPSFVVGVYTNIVTYYCLSIATLLIFGSHKFLYIMTELLEEARVHVASRW